MDTNLGEILTFLRGSWKRVAGGGEAAFGLRGMRGWVWWGVLGRGWCDGTAAGIRVREGEGCGGREVVGGWGYAGGGAAQ